jgi:hypothetical protein
VIHSIWRNFHVSRLYKDVVHQPEEAAVKRKLGLLMTIAAFMGIAASVAIAAASPSVTTQGPSKVKDTTAVLNGRVNPNGLATQYWFVWGLTPSYGATSLKHSAGSGVAPVDVHLTVDHLLPGTKYHYRLFAQNKYGLSAGSDHAFTTTGHPLPGVITGAAVNVGQSGATLTGTIIPNNQATQWEFQYGTTAGLYAATTLGGTVAAGKSPVAVSEPISGLAAGTTFHYRLVAVHAGFSASDGLDQTFTTFPVQRPYIHVRASTRPHRAHRRPFVFTTTGSVIPVPQFPSAAQCNGVVALRYFAGRRVVGLGFATVQPNCTFSARVRFTHTFKVGSERRRPSSQQLRLVIRFRGNNYLAPRRAHDEHVVLS